MNIFTPFTWTYGPLCCIRNFLHDVGHCNVHPWVLLHKDCLLCIQRLQGLIFSNIPPIWRSVLPACWLWSGVASLMQICHSILPSALMQTCADGAGAWNPTCTWARALISETITSTKGITLALIPSLDIISAAWSKLSMRMHQNNNPLWWKIKTDKWHEHY